MSLFAKLFNKNTGEVSSKNVEDFVSLTRVYFQSVIAANLGITRSEEHTSELQSH